MSESYSKRELESRIAELEDRVQKLDRKNRLLGIVATYYKSSPFDDPLKRFFDAPEFWEVIYEDAGACHNACFAQYRARKKVCELEEDPCERAECEIRANDVLLACRQGCPDLVG